MRFGIFDHLERRRDVDLVQQYEERMQLVELAESAGFHTYHVAEHHHSPLCLAPNQAVYLSSVAQRTKHLRFGPLVYVLPLYHPIRLIEEICMVDQLSGGRYQVGIGPGTGGGTEFALWGGDPTENYERFEETLEIVRKGLQNEYLSHEGQFFQFRNLWMELRPRQTPHPPFWWAGRAESAARRGANYVGASSIEGLKEAVATYRTVLDEVERDPAPYVIPPAAPLYGGMNSRSTTTSDSAKPIATSPRSRRTWSATFVGLSVGGAHRSRRARAVPGAAHGHHRRERSPSIRWSCD